MAKRTKKAAKLIEALVKARERYKDGNSCGDSIAKALAQFRTKRGLNIDGLMVCLKDNGCAVPKVDMNKRGAAGRFRMIAGLVLRAVARRRPIKIGGESFGKKARRGRTPKAPPEES